VSEVFQYSDAVGWAAGRPSGLQKVGGEELVCLSLERGANGLHYGPADTNATSSSLASVKSRWFTFSGADLARLSWKKAIKQM